MACARLVAPSASPPYPSHPPYLAGEVISGSSTSSHSCTCTGTDWALSRAWGAVWGVVGPWWGVVGRGLWSGRA